MVPDSSTQVIHKTNSTAKNNVIILNDSNEQINSVNFDLSSLNDSDKLGMILNGSMEYDGTDTVELLSNFEQLMQSMQDQQSQQQVIVINKTNGKTSNTKNSKKQIGAANCGTTGVKINTFQPQVVKTEPCENSPPTGYRKISPKLAPNVVSSNNTAPISVQTASSNLPVQLAAIPVLTVPSPATLKSAMLIKNQNNDQLNKNQLFNNSSDSQILMTKSNGNDLLQLLNTKILTVKSSPSLGLQNNKINIQTLKQTQPLTVLTTSVNGQATAVPILMSTTNSVSQSQQANGSSNDPIIVDCKESPKAKRMKSDSGKIISPVEKSKPVSPSFKPTPQNQSTTLILTSAPIITTTNLQSPNSAGVSSASQSPNRTQSVDVSIYS